MIKTLVIIILALVALWIACKILFDYIFPIFALILIVIVYAVISIISKIYFTAKMRKIQKELKSKIQTSHLF